VTHSGATALRLAPPMQTRSSSCSSSVAHQSSTFATPEPLSVAAAAAAESSAAAVSSAAAESAESTAVASSAAAPAQCAVRFYHAGTMPTRGKVRLFPRAGGRFTRRSLEALLVAEGEDLGVFGAWVFSEAYDGFVLLDDVELDAPLDWADFRAGEPKTALHVRLEARPDVARLRAGRAATGNVENEFFGIGIVSGKTAANYGTLWRSAWQLGAAFIFSVGGRYKLGAADTTKTAMKIPCFHAESWDAFVKVRPYAARLVGVEMGGVGLEQFVHPRNAVYVLGSEDHGLPKHVLDACNYVISIPANRHASYNVAVAGAIIMYDRLQKSNRRRDVAAGTEEAPTPDGDACDDADGGAP